MKKIDNWELNSRSLSIRKILGEDSRSPIDIFNIVKNIPELTIVMKPFGKNISGMCVKLEKSSVIAINTEFSKGRQNFTLAHELYHFYYSDKMTSSICPVSENKKDIEEIRANIFASYLLLPDIALREYFEEREVNLENIIKLENMYSISHNALLVRLLRDGFIDEKKHDKFKNGVINNAAMLGFDDSLYIRTMNTNTYGYYIKKTFDLFNKERISVGRKNEMLMDAMREDLVYGSNREMYVED